MIRPGFDFLNRSLFSDFCSARIVISCVLWGFMGILGRLSQKKMGSHYNIVLRDDIFYHYVILNLIIYCPYIIFKRLFQKVLRLLKY